MKTDREAPIGVFDSGVGGLTVAREIIFPSFSASKINVFENTLWIPQGILQ